MRSLDTALFFLYAYASAPLQSGAHAAQLRVYGVRAPLKRPGASETSGLSVGGCHVAHGHGNSNWFPRYPLFCRPHLLQAVLVHVT